MWGLGSKITEMQAAFELDENNTFGGRFYSRAGEMHVVESGSI